MGVVGGFLPAGRAARLKIVDALKSGLATPLEPTRMW